MPQLKSLTVLRQDNEFTYLASFNTVNISTMSLAAAKVAPEQNIIQKPVSEQQDFNRSETSILSAVIKKTQLSQSLKKSLSSRVQGEHPIDANLQQPQEESKLTQMVRTKIKQLKRVSICQICSKKFKRSSISLSNCEHKDSFCQSCLYLYAIYKIKQFEEVYCPADTCGIPIDTQGLFFKQLTQNLQTTYHKIHRFTVAAKDPQVVKLCPNQSCQGYLKLKQNQGLFCTICSKEYCPKCYLQRHEGECQDFQLNYFQNNLHYRQCRKCKMIVQKNKGCNHMTCKCKYQFCYICGERWSTSHSKIHQTQNQQPQPHQRIHHRSVLFELMECCVCNQCHQGTCGYFWNSCAGITIKVILKCVVVLMKVLLLVLQIVVKDIPVLVWMILCSLLIGMFFCSFQVICESDLISGVLLSLFLPVAMVMGAVRSYSQVFEPAIHEFYADEIGPVFQDFSDIIRF